MSQPILHFPVFITERLLLRETSLDDVPSVFNIVCRKDVNAWLETAPMQSIDEYEPN